MLGFAFLLSACARSSLTGSPDTPCPYDNMNLIPEGWFTMGENNERASNQPQHRVYLDAYCIHRQEVTQQSFSEFLSETGYPASGWPHSFTGAESELPATGVIWKDAQAYCQWAGLRLPSEAEWEKAARGSDGRRYPWGNDWDSQKANTLESGSTGPKPVGSFPAGASPYGILDMCGNVAEWVSDYFDPAYYSASPDHNPTGPSQVLDHGLRGGSFASASDQSTTFFRDSSHSAQPNSRVGFRCAVSLKR
jgi:formylglycine-generating enzyme required for sulfatase activity